MTVGEDLLLNVYFDFSFADDAGEYIGDWIRSSYPIFFKGICTQA